MTSTIENDKDTKSFYNNNITLSDESLNKKNEYFDNAGKDNDTKDSTEKNDGGGNINPEPVPFFHMFRYSTTTDRLLYFVGTITAIITGLTVPVNCLLFGDLSNAMIGYTASLYDTTLDTIRDEQLLDAVRTFAIRSCILGLTILICIYISIICFNYAAISQIFNIRSKYFKSLLHQDIAWYDFNKTGEVASRLNEDFSKMEEGLGEKVVMFITFLISFLSAFGLGFYKGWQLALVCLASLPTTFISMSIISTMTSKLAKQELNAYASAATVAEEALSGVRTVKSFGGESKEAASYGVNIVDARNLSIKRNLFSGLGFGLLWFFIYASYALAFWYGVGCIIKNYGGNESYSNYTPGTMITVFFSIMMGSMNIGMASPYIETFGIAKGACAKIFQIIEHIPTINPIEKRGEKLNGRLRKINFRNVEFHYPTREDIPILKKLNLIINRGETVALVGSSGCGKSTCIQLLQRFYDPVRGDILLNGVNLKEIDATWIRERIGVVGQEPILFGTSIYENIRYGNLNATRADIEAAAEASNAALFIKKLPQKYETLVGERGAQLSGGQKQRIAIARALVRNPDILLLDEATSALDTASEAKVQRALEKASEGRTTIIVAHRLSTIQKANKIVVLNEGVVVETGTHTELMGLQGFYFNLVNLQMGEADIQAASSTQSLIPLHGLADDEEEEVVIIKENERNEAEKKKKGGSIIWNMLTVNKPEWFLIVIGSISSIIIGAAMPLFALLFGSIIEVLSAKNDTDYMRSETNIYCLYFVLVGILVGSATFLQIYTYGIAGAKLTERLRGRMFAAMLRQEVAWFDDSANGTGSLCGRLSADCSAVQGATGQRIGSIIQSLATIVFGVSMAMYYEWSLGLITLAFTPFMLIAFYLQRIVMAEESMGNAKIMEESTKLAIESVSNIRTVASLGREDMFHDKYMDLLTPAVAKSRRNTHYRGLIYGLARSLMYFAYGGCMYYGGWCVINRGTPIGNVFKVSQSLIMGTAGIANALAFAPNMQKGLIAAEKIWNLIHRVPKIIDAPNVSHDPWQSKGNIRFDNITFSYPTRKEVVVLKQLIISIQNGQKIALVGPSGCGKSTCIQLIQRFYDPDVGRVLIDDIDVRKISLSNVRKQMGIVSQEPILFDRTIRENIAYGDNTREVLEQEIIIAAKQANIHNFVVNLPLGYETRMGEKGTQLSGGQKQRIAIARALLKNPKILLLDEATSALDAESEKVVQDALDAASRGRTTISIAHRLSTIVDCDIIYVIENGKICESGNHHELLQKKGLYNILYNLQSSARKGRC